MKRPASPCIRNGVFDERAGDTEAAVIAEPAASFHDLSGPRRDIADEAHPDRLEHFEGRGVDPPDVRLQQRLNRPPGNPVGGMGTAAPFCDECKAMRAERPPACLDRRCATVIRRLSRLPWPPT